MDEHFYTPSKCMNGKPRVYVAGPYTGDEEANTKRAIRAGNKIAEMGYTPFIPHLSHYWDTHLKEDVEGHDGHGYAFWMAQCIEWLKACDYLVRLPGDSEGATREEEAAEKFGIPVFDYYDFVNLAVSQSNLFCFIGPSGVGKTTIECQLANAHETIERAVSHTTRPMRDGEEEGIEYHFVDEMPDDLVEEVEYGGNQYGLSESEFMPALEDNKDVVVTVTEEGADELEHILSEHIELDVHRILILPPSKDELKKRLSQGRSDEEVKSRLQDYDERFDPMPKSDFVVINDHIAGACSRIFDYIHQWRRPCTGIPRESKFDLPHFATDRS